MGGPSKLRIAIVGGGTAGWIAAAALARALRRRNAEITVVDSAAGRCDPEAVAALPDSLAFWRWLGLDERRLVKATRATFRLGTEYRGWWGESGRHFQPSGHHGAGIDFLPFHHYLIRLRQEGGSVALDEYSLNAVATRMGKFTHPRDEPGSPLSSLDYGLHLDGAWYRKYLSGFARHHGVVLVKSALAEAGLDDGGRRIEFLRLADDSTLEADLYLDCTDDARLLEGALGVGFEDWAQWLPGDAVLAASGPGKGKPRPCTTVTAQEAGWLRSVPLADRVVHEFLYSTDGTDLQAAATMLNAAVGGRARVGRRVRRIRNGRRQAFWSGNCIALGPAAGGLEPLAGGDLQLSERGAARLAGLLPNGAGDDLLAGEYNRLTALEYANLRDYAVAHYQAVGGRGSRFWPRLSEGGLPESLQRRLRVFASQGQLPFFDEETFDNDQWASLLLGQGRWPGAYSRCLDAMDWDGLRHRFDHMRAQIRQAAEEMPGHGAYLAQFRGG